MQVNLLQKKLKLYHIVQYIKYFHWQLTIMKSFKLFKNIQKTNIKSKIIKPLVKARNMSHYMQSNTIPLKCIGYTLGTAIFGRYMYSLYEDKHIKNTEEYVDLTEELYYAIQNNNYDKVETLLKSNKVNVNTKFDGMTMLYKGLDTWNNNIAMIELLLKHKANPNEKITKSGRTYVTPLTYAVANCNKATVELLLKYGANPNLTYESKTPIQYAVSANNLPIVKLLIKNNAYINNHNIYSLLASCTAHMNIEMAEYLLSNKTTRSANKINEKGNYNRNLLHDMIVLEYSMEEKIKMAKLLIAHGIDIKCTDKGNNTAVSLAIYKIKFHGNDANKYDLVKLLIDSGAKITSHELVELLGYTSSSKYDTLKVLLTMMENCDKIKCMNEILFAVFNASDMNLVDIQMIKIFVEHGAKIESSVLSKIKCKDNIPKIKKLLNNNEITITSNGWLW